MNKNSSGDGHFKDSSIIKTTDTQPHTLFTSSIIKTTDTQPHTLFTSSIIKTTDTQPHTLFTSSRKMKIGFYTHARTKIVKELKNNRQEAVSNKTQTKRRILLYQLPELSIKYMRFKQFGQISS